MENLNTKQLKQKLLSLQEANRKLDQMICKAEEDIVSYEDEIYDLGQSLASLENELDAMEEAFDDNKVKIEEIVAKLNSGEVVYSMEELKEEGQKEFEL